LDFDRLVQGSASQVYAMQLRRSLNRRFHASLRTFSNKRYKNGVF